MRGSINPESFQVAASRSGRECVSKHSVQAGRVNLEPSHVTTIQAQVNPHSVPASRVRVRTLVGWSTLGSTAKQNRKVYYQTSNGAISLFFPGGGVGFCNSARLRDRVGSGFAFLCDRVRIPRGI